MLNALRLFFPPVSKDVDFADMCWLQIIRVLDKKLYAFVEEYLGLFAIVAGKFGMVGDDERQALGKRLLTLLPDQGFTSIRSIWHFSEMIPGIEVGLNQEPKKLVLNEISAAKQSTLENGKRLGSPQHYRFYFSFAAPSGTLKDAEVRSLLALAEQQDDLLPSLERLVATKRPQGGTMYGVLVDRLNRFDMSAISNNGKEHLIHSIINSVDDAERSEPRGGPFGRRTNWKAVADLLKVWLRGKDVKQRKVFLDKMFQESRSIGWLLEYVIGKELFAHGRVGDQSSAAAEWLLSDVELDNAITVVLQRVAGPDRAHLSRIPELMGLLYRWKQAGGESDAKAWVAEQILTDEGLVAFLDKCRGWRANSSGVSYPLKQRDLQNFLDTDVVHKHLEAIASSQTHNESMRHKAAELLDAWVIGDGW